MLQCPKCGNTFDHSWHICLYCNAKLRKAVDADEGTGYEKFPGNKFLIVVYSLLLMLLGPVMIIVLYMTYIRALDVEFIKHSGRQSGQAVYFEDEEAEKEN
ncbi:MAG: hypothetical protein P9L88_02375 [Candidatus Tantalella remota]|nr:hypothetical protein [Candidatus Tantalella remota]